MRKIWGVALVMALGCNGGKNETMTDGGTGETTGGTTEGTTNPTSTTNPTTSVSTTDNSGTVGETMGQTETSSPTEASGVTAATDPSTTASMTTAMTSGTTGETTMGDTTMGGPNGMVEDDCMAACVVFTECMLGPDPEMCVPSCVDDLGGSRGECLTATEEYLACIGTMTCEQAQAFIEMQDPGPCAGALQSVGMACQGGGDCVVGTDVNPQGTACSWTYECVDEPTLEMQCDKNECICLIDGMQAGEPCPSDTICKMPDGLDAKAQDCCGFPP